MNPRFALAGLIALAAPAGIAQDSLALQNAPPAGLHAAAHDIARGVTVAHEPSGRTLEWDGSAWSLVATGGPAAAPSITGKSMAMAYDRARFHCVLFNGATGNTWTWDGQTWSQVATTGPGLRTGAAMVYDRVRGRVVLHGGQTSPVTGFLAETWEWDGAAWSLASTAGPRTSQHGMSYDSRAGQIVLHGGVFGLLGSVPRRETWTFDGVTWNLVSTSGPTLTRGPLTFDAARGRTIAAIASNSGPAVLWEWDGATWIQASTVVPATLTTVTSLVYEPIRAVAVGISNGETFTWDGNTVTGQNTQAAPFLIDGIAAYDAARGELVVLDKFNNQNLTRVYDGTTWRVAATGAPLDLPDPRLAYDPLRRVIVLMSRTASGQAVEVWEWDGSAWTQASIATGTNSPSPRREFDIAFDPNSRSVMVFGGVGQGFVDLGDTWGWDGQAWTQLATVGPTRSEYRLATDTRRSRVVLFGGTARGGAVLDETWEWDGQQWLRVATTGPVARTQHDMAYDPLRGRVVLHGGNSNVRNDTPWEWDGRVWQQVAIQNLPALFNHAMFFDAGRQQIGVLAGRFLLSGNTFRELGWITRQALGEGCGPGTPPALETAPTRPTPGATLNVTIRDLPAAANSTWLGMGLEPLTPSIDLTPVGMPGCGLFSETPWLSLIPAAQGTATLTVPLPGSPSLSGLRVYAQAATLNPSAPGIGLTVSNGVVMLVE